MRRILFVSACALALGLTACSGDDGADGARGPAGPAGEQGPAGPAGPEGPAGEDGIDGTDGTDGQDGTDATAVVVVGSSDAQNIESISATIDTITIMSPPVVNFTVVDQDGRGIVGLKPGSLIDGACTRRSGGNVRFAMARLETDTEPNEPSSTWQNLLDQVTEGEATYDRCGELVDNGDGSYVYTFVEDVTLAAGYDATATTRISLQVGSSGLPPLNLVQDFVPDGSPVVNTRNVVDTANCNDCHDQIAVHGSRYEAGYCVMCHNVNLASDDDGTGDKAYKKVVDMSFMTHAIHAGGPGTIDETAIRTRSGAPDFELGGENYGGVTYPQSLLHCAKCHEESAATPDGNAWQTGANPTSCGGCHENGAIADLPAAQDTFEKHVAVQLGNGTNCTNCHDAADVTTTHRTVNPTTNNPDIPPGLSAFEYEIASLTVGDTDGEADRDDATVTFRVLRDGAVLDLNGTLPAGITAGGTPSLLFSWSETLMGMMSPDYNNSGNVDSQPSSRSVEGERGNYTVTTVNGEDFFTFTFDDVFPAGETSLRSVTLQGYYSEDDGSGGSVARHAVSVVRFADSDEPRRTIVDSGKCANCHEWFEAHGGNRVFEVQACATCHNPYLSSSGRGIAPANVDANEANAVAQVLCGAADSADTAALAGCGVDPANPLSPGDLDPLDPTTWPEATQNMKELAHAIHGSDVRSTSFRFVRDFFRGIRPYNFDGSITYPQSSGNCESCHEPGTYALDLPPGAAASTDLIVGTDSASTAAINAARDDGLPNDTDIVTTAGTAACVSCHDSPLSIAHMQQNGGQYRVERSNLAGLETCSVCHGSGKSADPELLHSVR